MLNLIDLPVVLAFIQRELLDFKYKDGAPPEGLAQKHLDEILRQFEPMPPCNYVVFQSISNMGLVDRQLELSPTKWTHGDSRIIVRFSPSSPHKAPYAHHYVDGKG